MATTTTPTTNPFKPGDTVRLKAGGPNMSVSTIDKFTNGEPRIHCEWFAGKKLERSVFQVVVLVAVKDDDLHGV